MKKWNNEKLQRIFERQKVMAISNNIDEDSLEHLYLDEDLTSGCSYKIQKMLSIAYYRGLLKGIQHVDEMITPITLDPLECPEMRFEIIPVYIVDGKVVTSLDEVKNMEYNKSELMFGIHDKLMNTKPEMINEVFSNVKQAELEKQKRIKQYYGRN